MIEKKFWCCPAPRAHISASAEVVDARILRSFTVQVHGYGIRHGTVRTCTVPVVVLVLEHLVYAHVNNMNILF